MSWDTSPEHAGPWQRGRTFLMMSISSGHVKSATKSVRKVTNMSSKKSRPAQRGQSQSQQNEHTNCCLQFTRLSQHIMCTTRPHSSMQAEGRSPSVSCDAASVLLPARWNQKHLPSHARIHVAHQLIANLAWPASRATEYHGSKAEAHAPSEQPDDDKLANVLHRQRLEAPYDQRPAHIHAAISHFSVCR